MTGDRRSGGGLDLCPTLAVPHQADVSLLWCATLQLAWDEAVDGPKARPGILPPRPDVALAGLSSS